MLVCNDEIRPVCAPQLAQGHALPVSPAGILAMPLACAGRWRDDWADWAESAGVTITAGSNIEEYESRAFMFDAALSGNAVILADARMTEADEKAGRLVELNPAKIHRPHGIYVVSVAKPDLDPRLDMFTSWIREQANSVPTVGN